VSALSVLVSSVLIEANVAGVNMIPRVSGAATGRGDEHDRRGNGRDEKEGNGFHTGYW
jgi:hypothetical protein